MACGDQRTPSQNQLSVSRICVLGMELGSSGFVASRFNH